MCYFSICPNERDERNERGLAGVALLRQADDRAGQRWADRRHCVAADGGSGLPSDRALKQFRARFTGKCSPVHFFWGSFDLAETRFSGRPAPLHPGGIPHPPDAVTREAYSLEVSNAVFWPGGGLTDYAAFYSYAYPVPRGFSAAAVEPAAPSSNDGLGEFLLPYEAVRTAPDPDAGLMAFLQSTYEAAANAAGRQRAILEREPVPPV
jgi:hypothetical protein